MRETTMTLVDPTCMTVSDLELEPVACVQPGTSLAQAARVLAATGLGVLAIETVPLVEVTEADVVEALASGRSPVTQLVDISRAAPQFVRPDTSADDAAAIMVVTGRRALIVVDEGRALGAITLRSAIGALWGGKSWLGALRIALHVERA
jgi:CBS domain-containing protein